MASPTQKLTEEMVKKVLLESMRGNRSAKIFPDAGKSFRQSLEGALKNPPKALNPPKDMFVIIDDAPPPFTEDEWKKLPAAAEKAIVRQSVWHAWDFGMRDYGSVATWTMGDDGRIHIESIETFPQPETPKSPAKRATQPESFFPNKIGRIANLPRYPGVWG